MSVPEKKDSDFILVNVSEAAVRRKTAELMKTMDVCQCETCYLNACAIVLNSVKPMYVTTKRGELFSEIETIMLQYQVDLTFDIMRALKIVSQSPRH